MSTNGLDCASKTTNFIFPRSAKSPAYRIWTDRRRTLHTATLHWVDDIDTLHTPTTALRKTKIGCTVGLSNRDRLEQMVNAGMDVARLNLSHGSISAHVDVARRIRRLSPSVTIIADTRGPEIRLNEFGREKDLKEGQSVYLTSDPSCGQQDAIVVNYSRLCDLREGMVIRMQDGDVQLVVKKAGSNTIECIVDWDASLREAASVCVANGFVRRPDKILTAEDGSDLRQLRPYIDFVGASFVQSASDVREVRNLSGKPVIAKLESRLGLQNMEEIIIESDGVLLGRGDLAMDIGIYKVFAEQKRVIQRCNELGKPVWPATHMLESMVRKPIPNCAEVGTASYAVHDGADGIFLSAETADGKYPIQSIKALRETLETVDGMVDYELNWQHHKRPSESAQTEELVAASIAQLSFDLRCPVILCVTHSGLTAQLIAKMRPRAAILAVTNSSKVQRELCLYKGVTVHQVDMDLDSILEAPKSVDPEYARGVNMVQVDAMAREGLKFARSRGLCSEGDRIIIVRSMPSDMDQYIKITSV